MSFKNAARKTSRGVENTPPMRIRVKKLFIVIKAILNIVLCYLHLLSVLNYSEGT